MTNFENIKVNEAAIFATIMNDGFINEDGRFIKGIPKSEILGEIQLIDTMLSVMKSGRLLNRKKNGLKKVIDGLLSIATTDESIIIGGSNLQIQTFK